MDRINWIDWAKAAAVTTVVFCHLPQSQDWFYYRYLQATIITIFFFLSGYLKKERPSQRDNWRKYWHSLVIPYVLLNLIVYPFWIVKFMMMNGEWPTVADSLKPLVGALLMQHEASFCCHLNGPLWYLPAVLLMHLLTDLSRRMRHPHWFMISCCVASVVLYAMYKQWGFAHSLTPVGFFRRLPYFYLGYVMGRQQKMRNWENEKMRKFSQSPNLSFSQSLHLSFSQSLHFSLLCAACFALSLQFFYWHLHEEQILWHIALFYPVCLLFLFGVVFGSKLIDSLHLGCTYKEAHPCVTQAPKVVTTLSVGTLLVIGLHEPFITVANYIVRLLFHTQSTPAYQWYEALPIALLITALLYPVILLTRRHFPVLMGR